MKRGRAPTMHNEYFSAPTIFGCRKDNFGYWWRGIFTHLMYINHYASINLTKRLWGVWIRAHQWNSTRKLWNFIASFITALVNLCQQTQQYSFNSMQVKKIGHRMWSREIRNIKDNKRWFCFLFTHFLLNKLSYFYLVLGFFLLYFSLHAASLAL